MPAKVATDHFVKTVAANSPFSVPRGEVRRVYEELATSLGVNMTSVRRRLQSLLADYKTGKSHGDEVDGYLKQLADEVEASGGADRRRKPARERSPSENLPTGGDPEEEEARGHEVPPVRQRSAAIAASMQRYSEYKRSWGIVRMCVKCGALFGEPSGLRASRVTRAACKRHGPFEMMVAPPPPDFE